jgi:signal transduction histidine kinase
MHQKNKTIQLPIPTDTPHEKGSRSSRPIIILGALSLVLAGAGLTLPEDMVVNGVIILSLSYLTYILCFLYPFQKPWGRSTFQNFQTAFSFSGANSSQNTQTDVVSVMQDCPVAVWDERAELQACNAFFADIMGAPFAEALQGKSMHAIFKKGGFEPCSLDFDAAFIKNRAGACWQVTIQTLPRGGHIVILQDASSMLAMQSRLIRYETELARLHGAMEDKDQQCRQAEGKIQEANTMRSEFMANVSHELRTPLNAIIGFSDLMTSGVFGPLGSRKYYDYCRDISESGHSLLRLINDVLDMSRIEAGRFELTRQDIMLDQVCLDSVGLLSIEAEKKNIHFKSEIEHSIPMKADQRALKQILFNVFSNAAKFTPAHGTVAVRARTVGKDVLITVADSGVGIPRSALKQLARPFEQVQSQMCKNHKGWGLGLAIARSLVEMHGGQLRLASREKVGTIVSIRIPHGQDI